MLDLLRSIVSGITAIINFFSSISLWFINFFRDLILAGKFIYLMFIRIGSYLGNVFASPYIVTLFTLAVLAVVLYRVVGWN